MKELFILGSFTVLCNILLIPFFDFLKTNILLFHGSVCHGL
jgi:hypothetical protein